MRKIHVITQKELVDPKLIETCTAIVIDVFLATSTITSLLEHEFSPVFAVKDATIALALQKTFSDPCLLMGESDGKKIENFHYPDPTLPLKENNKQAIIICSTNGTVAIQRAKNAKFLYASSLMNGHAVAQQIENQGDDSSIVIICSGNGGRFSLEDFVGAGQIVYHLRKSNEYVLSDAALVAEKVFLHSFEHNFSNLMEGETAQLLKRSHFKEVGWWVIEQFEKMNTVPIWKNSSFINMNYSKEQTYK